MFLQLTMLLVAIAVVFGPSGTTYFSSYWDFEWETFLIPLLPVYGISLLLCEIC